MVIELVGPAGVGKSAVAAELSRWSGVVRAGVWNLPRLLLARSAAASLTSLAALWRQGGRASAAKQLVRLGALEQLVGHLTAGRASAVVLDEGPVFALSWFRVFADAGLGHGGLDAWRRDATARWADALGTVVWLDAPDHVLLHRLRGRAKRDDVFSRMNDTAIVDLQAAYRAAFAQVIPTVTGARGARLLALDAEHLPADQLARAIAATFDQSPHGN